MCRDPLQCIVPPYVLEKMALSDNSRVREAAIENLQKTAEMRGRRMILATMSPALLYENAFAAAVAPGAAPTPRREVYHQGNIQPPHWNLPGTLRRGEGDPPTGDVAIDEAYDHSGSTWDFYWNVLRRNSLNGAGMPLISTVHAGINYDNAFWDGYQMVYGDGDGIVFNRFTASIDVVAHEFTHGMVQHTAQLVYQGEPGALNEHFADVFGILARQYRDQETAGASDWMIGKEVLTPATTRTAIRSMEAPGTAYRNDPHLGDDPQPDHYTRRYQGFDDNGGVHYNSGIPNRAFCLAAKAVGGYAWEKVGKVWYRALLNLNSTSDFAHCASETRTLAGQMFGPGVAAAVDQAWQQVGL